MQLKSGIIYFGHDSHLGSQSVSQSAVVVEDVVTAVLWMCLVQPGLFPVINPWRMAAGYPFLFLLWVLLLPLTHTFHTKTSSFLHMHNKGKTAAEGWDRVSYLPLSHSSEQQEDILCPFHSCSLLHTHTLSLHPYIFTSTHFNHGLLLDSSAALACVTGPLTRSQEILHSAKVTAGERTHTHTHPQLSCFWRLSFLAFMSPVKKTICEELRGDSVESVSSDHWKHLKEEEKKSLSRPVVYQRESRAQSKIKTH